MSGDGPEKERDGPDGRDESAVYGHPARRMPHGNYDPLKYAGAPVAANRGVLAYA